MTAFGHVSPQLEIREPTILALCFRSSFRLVSTGPARTELVGYHIHPLLIQAPWRGLTRRTSGDDDHVSVCEGFCEAVVDGFITINNLIVRCLVYEFLLHQ